jgi:MYXO-CTERM domain-containing protein
MMTRLAYTLATLALLLVPASALAETVEVGPMDGWCAAINDAAPGDEIVLMPGRYTNPCVIRATGSEGSEIVVRGSSTAEGSRSILDYDGSSSNVIDFNDAAGFVVLRDLFWDPTNPGIDAIKIKAGHDLAIEGCYFEGIGGISISANSSSVERITVRNNVFVDLQATGLYFGCHDGEGCHATDILVEGNLIDRVDSDAVGYGLEVKLNSWAVIRDNTVYDTKGPGLMVYGSNRGDPPSIVEGNYVEGSRHDGAIVVGGGPAIVRNNVTLGGNIGGIVAQDYGGRGLQDNVWIVHNTSFANSGPSIRVQSWAAGAGNVLAANALDSATQPATPEGTVTANVICDPLSDCFVAPGAALYDLWPTDGSPLMDSAGMGDAEWSPAVDFMGEPRGDAPDVGAFERVDATTDHSVGGGGERPPRTGGTGPGVDGGTPLPDGGGVPVHDGGGLPGTDGGTGGCSDGGDIDTCAEDDDCVDDDGCSCATTSPARSLPLAAVILLLLRRRPSR